MDYKKWLDEVVKAHKKLVEADNENPDEVCMCLGTIKHWNDGTPSIHIYRGLEALAESVGAKIKSDAFDRYYFEYDGCRVYSLEVR